MVNKIKFILLTKLRGSGLEVSYKLNISDCAGALEDPKRLAALDQTKQMQSGSDEAFDRLTFLASKLLNVPLTIVSFVGKDKQYFKSFYGLPEPWATEREIPIQVSVCQHTLIGNVLSLADARESPLLANNPAIPALNLVGYLGVPLIDQDGNNLGAFCAISNERRDWSDSDIETLKVLTKSIMSEIELNKKIEFLNKEKEDWESTIALLTHDIRSPLATAYSFSKAALEMQDPKVTSEALGSIERTTNETLKLVDRLLDWRKDSLEIEENSFTFFNIKDDLNSILSDYRETEGASFTVDIGENSTKLFGNSEKIMRSIRNLLSNAVKYGDLSKNITFSVRPSQGLTSIEVHNYGQAIPNDQIGEIFKIGKRASSRSNKKSWGFGLAQVLATAQAHHGAVTVTSDPEDGTKFTLTLPSGPA